MISSAKNFRSGIALFFLKVLLFLPLLAANVQASNLSIPTQLTSNDRSRILEILGYGSGSRILSIPYALGGESGIEIGLGYQSLPTSQLSTLGSKTQLQDDFGFFTIEMAKGLYHNLDFSLQAAPFFQEDISHYGAQIRWTFFESKNFPASWMSVVHFSNSQFRSQMTTQTTGIDFVGSVFSNGFVVYGGLGSIRTQGQFIGGAYGITSSQSTESEITGTIHFLGGVSFFIKKYFASIQMDKMQDNFYAIKIGQRW
jgi:hypothetical protein